MNIIKLCSPLSAHIIFFRDDLSYMEHHSPYFEGIAVLHTNKLAMEKMAIINTFGPVLINGQCIGYILPDRS